MLPSELPTHGTEIGAVAPQQRTDDRYCASTSEARYCQASTSSVERKKSAPKLNMTRSKHQQGASPAVIIARSDLANRVALTDRAGVTRER